MKWILIAGVLAYGAWLGYPASRFALGILVVYAAFALWRRINR